MGLVWEQGTSAGFEWYQIVPKWAWVTPWIIRDKFDIIQSLQRSPIPQTSILAVTFIAAFYSKPTLVLIVF